MTTLEFMLVTVGTTSFDDLVVAADAAALELRPLDGLIQTGEGAAQPAHLPHQAFVPGLGDLFARASVVVAHGGAATTFEVLRSGAPLVSVANPDRYDDHQTDLLRVLDEAGHLIWCRELSGLVESIERALATPLAPLQEAECTIAQEIDRYLAQVRRPRPIWRRVLKRRDR